MSPPTKDRRPREGTGDQETTRANKPLVASVPRGTDNPRHRLCESHVKRHFCVSDLWRRRKVSAELTGLCGGRR